jgi:hypothetical protein
VRRFRSLAWTALLVAPMAAFGSHLPLATSLAVIQVPEYWDAPDSLAFFVVALGIFGVLVRSKVLRRFARNGK